MERLTEHHVNKSLGAYKVCSMDCDGGDFDFICNYCKKLEDIVNLLASYEDTGLEPEKVEAQSIALAQCKPYIDAICDEHGKMLINPIRLAWLAQAEKDCRLVVLPCKVGSIVYAITSPVNVYELESEEAEDIFECTVESVAFYSNGNAQFRLYYHGVFVASFVTVDDFGKTVFLTREEAEAALKKREEADNATD